VPLCCGFYWIVTRKSASHCSGTDNTHSVNRKRLAILHPFECRQEKIGLYSSQMTLHRPKKNMFKIDYSERPDVTWPECWPSHSINLQDGMQRSASQSTVGHYFKCLENHLYIWRCCSGLWLRVNTWVDANVSEKHTVSILSPEAGGNIYLRNIGVYLRVYTALKQRTPS
jgi:hypothetical protein